MRVHILGICGTFMGGVAVLAQQMGFTVSGSDENVYPPMSDTLRAAGITITEGFGPKQFEPKPDVVIIGNVMSRGNPAVEYVLNHHIPYISGPQWLAENVLRDKHVLAVSGTHGKTTTTSMLTWILESAGLKPGFLVGGVPLNFNKTAELGGGEYFVIEADEYDSAFFDKRSKFIHYHPNTLIINNLEFDHADIFADLAAIQQQFQYLVRTVPGSGKIIYPKQDAAIKTVINQGCWSAQQTVGAQGDWQARDISPAGNRFTVWHRDQKLGTVEWNLLGQHNIANALAAIAAANDVGVSFDQSVKGLKTFKNVKRRLEVLGTVNDITVYDDFAHHPTAIELTLQGLRAKVGNARIIAVLQCGSYTMHAGVHRDSMADALKMADRMMLMVSGRKQASDWDGQNVVDELAGRASLHASVDDIIAKLQQELRPGDHVIIMSNKGFDGIHQRLLKQLGSQCETSVHREIQ